MSRSRIFMAFDFGERRTGVALGQELMATARPLTTLLSVGLRPDWNAIESLITEWQPTDLIIGIPAECEKNKAIRQQIMQFCRELHARFSLPVQLHDETLTSDEAYHQLKNQRSNKKRKINKTDIDQYAAALLLESWMNTRLTDKQ